MSDELDDILKGAARENLERMGISERIQALPSSKKLNLVHRLRQNATSEDCLNDPDPSLLTEAATEIERLRGAIENYFNTTGKWKPERDGYGWRYTLHAALSGEPSPDETSGKLMPCWCPYCGEPHGVRRAETDPRGTQCQHDRFKSGFTLQWLGSTPDIRVNTHRFQCRICRETFDLAVGEAQLSSAVKASGEPT